MSVSRLGLCVLVVARDSGVDLVWLFVRSGFGVRVFGHFDRDRFLKRCASPFVLAGLYSVSYMEKFGIAARRTQMASFRAHDAILSSLVFVLLRCEVVDTAGGGPRAKEKRGDNDSQNTADRVVR